MTAEEYAAFQAVIAAAAAAYAAQAASMFSSAALSISEWVRLLEIMYPVVVEYRRQSADLGRRFYDSQREQFHPELPRHDVPLEGYEFDWFVRSMEPVRKRFSQPNAPEAAVGEFAFQFVREVENAGRKQIIYAVETDRSVTEKVEKVQERIKDQPWIKAGESRPVQGWARVATGRETCAWCLMLISRGPVYPKARAGGSRYDSETTIRVIKGETELDDEDYMKEWHTGCDCKVVPVFDEADWPGKAAMERALELWNDSYDDAVEWRERYPDRVHLSGKNKGEPFTLNEDRVLALRRRLESGAISSQEWAALTPAA